MGNKNKKDVELSDYRKKVLVLDDSEMLRNLIKFVLEEQEYKVRTVAIGREALKNIVEWHPDLMICDINLAGSSLSGLDVLKKSRKIKSGMKIIMLSSKADTETVKFCNKNGADAFIKKPFKNDELVIKISYILTDR